MRKLRVILALAGLACLVVVMPASAAGLTPPVADCYAHTQLTRSYTAAELRQALATMPADVKEYSDCYDVIQRALLAKIGKLGAGGPAGSGGSFLPTWLIVVVALLVVGGVGFGAVALRNRGAAG